MPFLAGLLNQQDVAAGGGAYPSIFQTIVAPDWASNSTTHNVVLGAASSIAAGDLLLACIAMDATATISCTGWTKLGQVNSNSGSGETLVKVAAGTEGGSTVNFATSTSEAGGGFIYHIKSWGGTIATHVSHVSGTVFRDGTGFAAPSLSPSFGAAEALWIISAATSLSVAPTGTMPTDWTLGGSNGATGTTGGIVITGYRELNTASNSPGTIPYPSTSGSAACFTIAVKGV